ncbi:hypothetical protein LCGC14_1683640 [marine sediment metagenome]|uniref:Uncharacterized protein n=1 Tax=marine sediment metagenome TaxID=412755 RepID=A0A0F9HN08_9ZZZZ
MTKKRNNKVIHFNWKKGIIRFIGLPAVIIAVFIGFSILLLAYYNIIP